MYITCLDVEGVLVPEIWIAFAEASGIPELKKTTRDEPDYDKLMNWRLGILKEHGLGLKEIQDVIAKTKNCENRVLAISHCNCPERAKAVKEKIEKIAKFKKIIVTDTAGVSTMYANDGGVIIAV